MGLAGTATDYRRPTDTAKDHKTLVETASDYRRLVDSDNWRLFETARDN